MTIEIVLSDVTAVASKTGQRKERKVSEIKNREPYHPMSDFYKPLREGIAGVHRHNKAKDSLYNVVEKVPDPRKKKNYPPVIDA